MKRYRILVVCGGSHVSGLEIMNLTLIKQLKEMGHSVTCLVSGWNDGTFISRLQALEIPYTVVKLGNIYITRPTWSIASILNLPTAILHIKNILKQNKPDVIILNDSRNFLYTGFIWNGLNIIFWEHNLPSQSIFNTITYKKLYKKAAIIVACSDFVKKRLETLILQKDKIKTVYNGIEITENNLTKVSNKSDSCIRIGIVGQVIPRKNHLVLIEALSVLRKEGLNCTLYIYGNNETEYAATVRDFIYISGLSEYVHWMGFLTDKITIFSNLDIVVVPSEDEPFGLVALEPALWKIPVVAAHSGGLTELIEAESTGLFFQPGDSHELAAQLLRLINQPNLISQMGHAAQARVVQHFSATKMAVRFVEIFDQLNRPKISKK